MKYDDVKIRTTTGQLVLQNGEAKKKDGVLEVAGKLERGVTFRPGARYKAEGDPGLKELVIYMDEVGGIFRFKID